MNILHEIIFKTLKPEVGLINIYKSKSYMTQNRVIFVITETTCSRCVCGEFIKYLHTYCHQPEQTFISFINICYVFRSGRQS